MYDKIQKYERDWKQPSTVRITQATKISKLIQTTWTSNHRKSEERTELVVNTGLTFLLNREDDENACMLMRQSHISLAWFKIP